MPEPRPASVSAPLRERLGAAIAHALHDAGGWLPFDRFMALALYAPGLGYYARGAPVFGLMPASGSDFVTAPELSPLFGRTLAVQVAQALKASGTDTVYEFGAGSGALAQQLLQTLGPQVRHYAIVDVSGSLRARQAERLSPFGATVQWLDAWPEAMAGVVVGNEVLDAMPVKLLHFDGTQWLERGVTAAYAVGDRAAGDSRGWSWADRPTTLRPPVEAVPFASGTVTEIHLHAEAFMRALADRLQRGVALFIDYGFPEAEYYHPQRAAGTLMCHHRHRADAEPLQDVGDKDITAHVNFSGVALAAQEAGLDVLGYTSQARFLLNCGIAPMLEQATLPERAMAGKLLTEHEMGELFKVLALGRGVDEPLCGFAVGDRLHTL